MTTPRRSAADDSAARTALLDATQELMLEEGYAAVSSRRVSAKVGMNSAMVYYYFGTMDGLFIELFRRGAERSLERQVQVLKSPQPLWGLWDSARDLTSHALTMEFIALANHRKSIRAEIASYSKAFRQTQLDLLSRILPDYGLDADAWPPVTVILMITGISRFLLMEDAFDIDLGHREMIELIERHIWELEGERKPTTQVQD